MIWSPFKQLMIPNITCVMSIADEMFQKKVGVAQGCLSCPQVFHPLHHFNLFKTIHNLHDFNFFEAIHQLSSIFLSFSREPVIHLEHILVLALPSSGPSFALSQFL